MVILFDKVNPLEYLIFLEGRRPTISSLAAFGCKCIIHKNGKENFTKFYASIDEGGFIG